MSQQIDKSSFTITVNITFPDNSTMSGVEFDATTTPQQSVTQ